MIVTNNLNVYYGKKQILFDISLEIKSGERVLIVGPNGAGKSTLMRAIAGITPVSGGAVVFQGQDISHEATDKRVARGIVHLLQTGNIVPSRTVTENLCLAGYPYSRRVIEPRMESALGIFPFLKEKLNTRGGYLSGGQRQALAICMVLMKRPSLLLLDEPSAGLSPKAAGQILDSIAHAQESLGIETVCMVEHRLRESLPWASKLIVLAGGRVAHMSDKPMSFINNPQRLERFYF